MQKYKLTVLTDGEHITIERTFDYASAMQVARECVKIGYYDSQEGGGFMYPAHRINGVEITEVAETEENPYI